MFNGLGKRWINLDGLSTHLIINEIAYRHAMHRTPKKGFPRNFSIDLMSGYYGPDGGWTKDHLNKVSHHMYNPTTDTGEAINCAIDASRIAAQYITSRKKIEKKIGQLALAR